MRQPFLLLTEQTLKKTLGFLLGGSEILLKEFQTLFKVLQFKNKKEKHLLRHWINVSSKNFTDVIKKWYNLYDSIKNPIFFVLCISYVY